MFHQKFIGVISLFLFLNVSFTSLVQAQSQAGTWYVYFFKHQFKESNFGIQGDTQYHDWKIVSDFSQFIVRSGVTFTPKNTRIKFVLGYAYVLNGKLGESKETINENRIYQEILLPQKVGSRFYFTHRFRYEERFVENQDFRTRFRYNLFLNVPLNKKEFEYKAIYLTFYNELFINGEKSIGNDIEVEYFDRNRTYLGLGYFLKPNAKLQLGWIRQVTNLTHNGQVQLSLFHTF